MTTRKGKQASAPIPGSLGQYITTLHRPPSGASLACPAWPPDIFAITGSILYQTGEYRRLLQPAGASEESVGTPRDWREARSAGSSWRVRLDNISRSATLNDALKSTDIVKWWKVLTQHSDLPMARLTENVQVIHALLMLFLAADEACDGIGMQPTKGGNASHAQNIDQQKDDFVVQAQYYLAGNDGRTLCLHVRPDLVRVLPKLHTAQVGHTLRSLTHNLALCRATGIDAFWNFAHRHEQKNPDSLNLLLLPWPVTTDPGDFGPIASHEADAEQLPPNAGYFKYAPRRMSPAQFGRRLQDAITCARQHSDIHAVVFPELSLDEAQYAKAERIAWDNGLLLIAGVQAHDTHGPQNLCVIQPLGMVEAGARRRGLAKGLAQRLNRLRLVQSKHHRWCLDKSQILQYGLGGRLSVSRRWWEHACIPPRWMNFVALGNWLTWCVLICEDLARQDPAAELIRSIGPSLVIALLMDGPQLQKRWPARYATVLAEDPGSSVLTFTNLGMVRRSRPPPTKSGVSDPPAGDVIALWSDRMDGTREICLTGNQDACILNLACHSVPEFTADGHGDGGAGHFVVYAGHYPFCSSEKPTGGRSRRVAR